MPDFGKPTTRHGAQLRKEAAVMAGPIPQSTYLDNLRKSEKAYRQGAEDAVWRITNGDAGLQSFAAADIGRKIQAYGRKDNPSGSSAEWLTRICGLMDLELGDLLETKGDANAILALVKRKKK